LSLWEEDACTQVDLQHILREIEENEHPIYKEGDKVWFVDELLAQGKFEEVLNVLIDIVLMVFICLKKYGIHFDFGKHI